MTSLILQLLCHCGEVMYPLAYAYWYICNGKMNFILLSEREAENYESNVT
jgi:hypothetical protein